MNKRQAKKLAWRAAYGILSAGYTPDPRELTTAKSELGIQDPITEADDRRFQAVWDEVMAELYWRGRSREE